MSADAVPTTPLPEPSVHAFTLSVARALGTVVITVHGPLVATNATALDATLTDLIDGQGNLTMVLDLHDVDAVDFAGLAVLVGWKAAVAGRGGSLSFADPRPAVIDALEAAGEGAAVVNTRPWLRSVPPATSDRDRAERRRTSMTHHPARPTGTDR